MKRLCTLVFLLLLLTGCHFHLFGGSRKAGWTDDLIKLANLDCQRLWENRGLETEKIAPLCQCVTKEFSTHFTTEEMSSGNNLQRNRATELALGCVRTTGVDLAKITRPQKAQAR
jgi:hypothetical protein